MNGNSTANVDRRRFLRQAGLAGGAFAALPLLGTAAWAGAPSSQAANPRPSNTDPDQLFAAGWFEQADRGYAHLLHKDPCNAHAAARRGRIALMSNKFTAAEEFLAWAVRLAPDDNFSKRQLADCFVRQDRTARAVPLLRATGDLSDAAFADQYASLTSAPYQMHGAQATRVPFLDVDPLPQVAASVNGAQPATFLIDTGATFAISKKTAQRAGLRAVSTSTSNPGLQTRTTYHGVMESFRMERSNCAMFPSCGTSRI